MEANIAILVQLVLSVPFCLQFWFSYLKLQRKEVVQVVTKSGSGIPFPGFTICRKSNPNVILNEWYVYPLNLKYFNILLLHSKGNGFTFQ